MTEARREEEKAAYDTSAMIAQELMAELMGAEEKKEKAVKRNKRKKESSKLKKLAKK